VHHPNLIVTDQQIFHVYKEQKEVAITKPETDMNLAKMFFTEEIFQLEFIVSFI
jgi:hypothetical protein